MMLRCFANVTATLLLAGALPLAPLRVLNAQDVPPRISWTPERPVQGTLFRIRVADGSDQASLSGNVAGESIHFSKTAAGWEALAAAPLEKGSRLDVVGAITTNTRVDAERAHVPIAKGSYALEMLTVARRFGTRPDSALQARMDRERERALPVSRASHATPRLWQDVLKPRDTRITSAFGSGL